MYNNCFSAEPTAPPTEPTTRPPTTQTTTKPPPPPTTTTSPPTTSTGPSIECPDGWVASEDSRSCFFFMADQVSADKKKNATL